jgi:hypothetical protein
VPRLERSSTRPDRDFSDAERDLLERARPFLIQIYRNAIDHDRLKHRPTSDVVRTALRKLGVSNRSDAAELLWSL